MLLNEGMKGLPFYRSVFYLPSMLGSSVAIAVLWRQMFEVDGLVNQVLRKFGIPATTSWIGDPQYALWTIILLHVWTFGSPMVIFLAGLRQIPECITRQRRSTGASRWAQFRKITLPLLSPIIFFNLVLQIINAIPGIHAGLRGSNGDRRSCGLDAVLYGVPLPARVRPVPDGLCRRDGLAARGDHRGFHRCQLLLLKVLGVLR
jgi:multiple sugar transport system permease protein